MNIVVTGASGFIGRNVLLRAPREWTIYATYHATTDLPAFVEEHGLTHVRPVRCNLVDPGDVARLASMIGTKPDAMLRSEEHTSEL